MNEFYSIAGDGLPEDQEFQLTDLGARTVSMSFGFAKKDGYGGTKYSSQTITRPVTVDDYDQAFAFKALKIKPAYRVRNLLDFHYDNYLNKNLSGELFVEHVLYVILPIIKKRKDTDVFVDLIGNWIKSKTMEDKKASFGGTSISGSNNVVNIANGNISQSNISLTYSAPDLKELKEWGVGDNHIEELREIIEKHRGDKPSATTKMFKWLADVGKALTVKGLSENLPAITDYLGRQMHNL